MLRWRKDEKGAWQQEEELEPHTHLQAFTGVLAS
jgi:hypothetical protein